MESAGSTIEFEIEGALGRLVLKSPDTGSFLQEALPHDLHRVLDSVKREKAIRALVLTAGARCFNDCPADVLDAVLAHLRGSSVPVVIAISGKVSGAGILLALGGDWVLVAEDVVFSGWCEAQRTAEKMGLAGFPPPAMDPASPGKDVPLSAVQVLQSGLVNECLPPGQLASRALAVAQQLSEGPTHALVATRALVDEAAGNSFEAQYRRELEVNRDLRERFDSREGVQAFLEKRPPRFRGE